MTYQQALDFMYACLPIFQKRGEKAYNPGFKNILLLCEKLGNPQYEFKAVHIAGTNGKGSSAHMLAAVLQIAGYKTGLYTSPHLKEFTERIKLNGKEVSQQFIADWVSQYQTIIEAIKPSFFEVTVAMAFDYFAKQKVDIAIIETGLGGRLDATNIIEPEVSLITNIGYDHMHILGDTLSKIAAEKAGIIKPNAPVVISELQEEIAQIFKEKAKNEAAPIYCASEVFEIIEENERLSILKEGKPFIILDHFSLLGKHQFNNLKGVLATLAILQEKRFVFTQTHLIEALAQVQETTGLKGRWQILGQQPLIICDVAHNEAGLSYVSAEINKQKFEKLHIVFGMLKEKDPEKLLWYFPKGASFYLCQPDNNRAFPVEKLVIVAKELGLNFTTHNSVNQAFLAAKNKAAKQDMIFIGGSTFVVAEVV